ncbi:MAG: NAD+ synthase [Opitutaceae bacterium]|nr:NAD+ synthase [Opitutaceae bacterium]
MRIGLAQINTTVGDLSGNRKKIIQAYQQLHADGAELIIFPELAVCGYPPRDLLLKRRFVSDTEESLLEIAAATDGTPLLVGYVETNPAGTGRAFFNSAAFCQNGAVISNARKCLLPTYDVFDEDRYFEAANKPTLIHSNGLKIGITICEDIWTHPINPSRPRYAINPIEELNKSSIDLLINLSASPWHFSKENVRENLIKETAKKCGVPLIYCNAVGGNDELIFDGRSMVADSKGNLVAGLKAFKEDHRIIDLETSTPAIDSTFKQDDMQDIYDALVLGLRDYAHKSGFQKALIGLSGGIDSALTAVLAVEALGAENITGISLPSKISSQHSRDDARILAETLKINFQTLPIANIVEAASKTLAPLFDKSKTDTTEENVQARSRGLLLMAVSNKFGALLLTTGNKSELAVGYCTLYGDMAGGLAVISDLPKTKVYDLSRFINRDKEIIPVSTIEKPPSAELSPDQKDEDSLPPYPVLDAILKGYVEEGLSSRDLVSAGFKEELVKDIIRKVDLNEYKRKQAAPGLKITPLAFGVGRRIPIVQKYVS